MNPEDWFINPADSDIAIEFYSEDVDFVLDQEKSLADWINEIISLAEKKLLHLNFIFCSDPYLHHINVEYLNHDTLTDIITFPYSELPQIEGDIFISIDRVRENASEYKVPFDNELRRVISHGVLHLCGYGDKTAAEKEQMRSKEDEALALWEKRAEG